MWWDSKTRWKKGWKRSIFRRTTAVKTNVKCLKERRMVNGRGRRWKMHFRRSIKTKCWINLRRTKYSRTSLKIERIDYLLSISIIVTAISRIKLTFPPQLVIKLSDKRPPLPPTSNLIKNNRRRRYERVDDGKVPGFPRRTYLHWLLRPKFLYFSTSIQQITKTMPIHWQFIGYPNPSKTLPLKFPIPIEVITLKLPLKITVTEWSIT